MNQPSTHQRDGPPNSDRPLVLYHAGCADGQGSAAAFYSKYPDAEFYPAAYGHPVPDVTGRHVFMVDFSYPRAVVESLCDLAASVTIIDHHKSAFLDLQGLEHPNLVQCFNMDYSGAVLTWMWCWPGRRVPKMLAHIEDRDLWKFHLADTRTISAYLYSTEFDIAEWAALLDDTHFRAMSESILQQGEGLLRQDQKRVKEIAKNHRMIQLEGHVVPAVNCNHYFASDVGSVLAKGYPFAVCYYDNARGRRVFSLRANKGGVDVSLIAKRMGGGGHAAAAGFNLCIVKAQRYELPKRWQLLSRLRLTYARWLARTRN